MFPWLEDGEGRKVTEGRVMTGGGLLEDRGLSAVCDLDGAGGWEVADGSCSLEDEGRFLEVDDGVGTAELVGAEEVIFWKRPGPGRDTAGLAISNK